MQTSLKVRLPFQFCKVKKRCTGILVVVVVLYTAYLRGEACFNPVAISRKKTDLLYGCVFASGRIEMAENQNKSLFTLACPGL